MSEPKNKELEKTPGIFKTWKNLYLFVMAFLGVIVVLLYLLSTLFS